jgi:hypothetical protein
MSVSVNAIDWSGRKSNSKEYIWRARSSKPDCLEELVNGFDRDATANFLIAICKENPQTVVGLDFAFSFPAWFHRKKRLRSAHSLWRMAAREAEKLGERMPVAVLGTPRQKKTESA